MTHLQEGKIMSVWQVQRYILSASAQLDECMAHVTWIISWIVSYYLWIVSYNWVLLYNIFNAVSKTCEVIFISVLTVLIFLCVEMF